MMGPIFSGGFAIFGLIYILIILFLLWLTYRFVKAHEKIADSMYEIKAYLKRLTKDN